MNTKKLLFSTAAVGVLSGLLLSGSSLFYTPSYVPRTALAQEKTVQDAYEYYQSLRLDENGVYNQELILETRDRIMEKYSHPTRAVTNVAWYEQGPDNIGGRTRAICIDRTWSARIWAGSVSGGLFYSMNGGNNWGRLDGFNQSLAVSAMCQTVNNRLYVGTGFNNAFRENFVGDGMFYSDDLGVTFTQVAGTSSAEEILELQADPNNPNKIWMATGNGLKTYDHTVNATPVVVSAIPTNRVTDLKISKDGNVMVLSVNSSGIRTYVSTDAGANWTNVSGTGSTQIPSSNTNRIEYAISHEKVNGMYNIYATCASTSATLKGMYASEDNGMTWSEIAPSGTAAFDPFVSSSSNQADYNMVISAIVGRPDMFLVGGLDVYAWEKAPGIVPTFGQFEQKSLWFASPQSPVYVHADNHEMEWSQEGLLYIGNDGGIGISPDKGNFFFPANRGYNVTQFYSVAYSADGDVMGGSQDNGSLLNTHTGSTLLSFDEIRGGDGFDCDISHLSQDVIFASVYNGDMQRSDDGGGAFNPFFTAPSGSPFNTVGRLYENLNDQTALENTQVIVNQNYSIGDTIWYESKTLQTPLFHIATAPVADGDTLSLVDYVQSLYAMSHGASNGLYVTREAMRFSVAPNMRRIMNSTSGNITCIEFSHDGEHLYFGTTAGKVVRVSGFSTFYAPAYDETGLTFTQIFDQAGGIGGIAVDMNDPEHVVITQTGFATSQVYESFSAASATAVTSSAGSFTSIHGSVANGLDNIPVYDAVISSTDPNVVIIGTEFGVYITDNTNGTSTVWVYQNQTNGPGLVPVYAVRQQWRKWSDGTNRPGEVYIGTHGRGIWSTDSYLGQTEIEADNTNVEQLSVTVYPNPMRDNGQISFELKEAGNATLTIYGLNGQLVATTSLGRLNAGKQTSAISTAELASGTYIVRVQTEKSTQTGKLVVAK